MSILNNAISLEKLAEEILANTRKAVEQPDELTAQLIKEHGKDKVYAAYLGAVLSGFNPQTPGIDFVKDGKLIHRVEGVKR